MRPSFDHIIVDLGSRLDPRSLWLLEQADAHVFILFPEIAALRAMSLLMAFPAETTPPQGADAHRHEPRLPQGAAQDRDVENLLQLKPAAEIPYTEVDMIRSVNEGVPLVTSRPGIPGHGCPDAGGAGGRRHRTASRRSKKRTVGGSSAVVGAQQDAGGGIRTPMSLRAAGFKPAAPAFRHSGAVSTAYAIRQRHFVDHPEQHPPVSVNRLAAQATTHCLTGCAIGEVLGMVLGNAFGWTDVAIIVAVATVLAFVFGYGLTLWPLVSSGMPLRAAPRPPSSPTPCRSPSWRSSTTQMLAIPGAMDARTPTTRCSDQPRRSHWPSHGSWRSPSIAG